MRPLQDISQRLPRDTHLFSGLFLIQPFEIGQAHGFQFVLFQLNGFEQIHRHALRLEMRGVQAVTDLSLFLGSWHGAFMAYAKNNVHCFLQTSFAKNKVRKGILLIFPCRARRLGFPNPSFPIQP